MDAALTVEGRNVLFAHWPVAPETLRPHVPDPLVLDARDGRAWVSVVVHRIAGLGFPGLPAVPPAWTGSRSFAQLNCRTYVEHGDRTGVYFLDCETGAPLAAAVARRTFGLPFRRADARLTERGGWFRFRSRRSADAGTDRDRGRDRDTDATTDVRFDARYRPAGDPELVDDEDLAAFLVDRSRWFVVDGDRIRIGTVERAPWQVAPAEAAVVTNTLPDALGIDVSGGSGASAAVPTLHYSPGFELRATRPRTVETATSLGP